MTIINSKELYATASNILTISKPKYYHYEPKEDITTYELANIVPIFRYKSLYDYALFIESLPDNCKRHFIASSY